MSETDISLKVGLETQDAEKTAKDLQKEIKDIFESRTGESSASLTNLEIQMKKNYDQAQLLQEQLDELKKRPPEIDTSQIEDSTKELEALRAKQERLRVMFAQEVKFGFPSATHRKNIRDMGNELLELDAKIKELEAGPQPVIIPIESTEEYKKLEAQIDATNDKLKQQIIRYREIEMTQDAANEKAIQRQLADGTRAEEKTKAAAAKAAAEAMKKSRAEMIASNKAMMGLESTARGLMRLMPGMRMTGIYTFRALRRGITQLISSAGGITTLIKKIGTAIASHPAILAITALIAAIVLLIKKLRELKQEAEEFVDNLIDGLKDAIKVIGKAGKNLIGALSVGFIKIGTFLPKLFAKSINAIINKLMSLKSIVTENIKLMAQWNNGNNGVNTALSNITSSLNYLKATVATVVAPILTVVEPMLTRIIDRLAEMTTQVGMFIAKLTGASKFQKAIKLQKDYAEALAETNGQLSSFDKLNVIGQDNTTVDFGLYDIEETPIPKWFDDLESIGRKVGIIVTNALGKIPWKAVKKNAKDAAKGIADFIDGISGVEGLGDSIGRTLGQAVNTVSGFINNFLDNLDGVKLGEQIGNFFETAIKVVDWEDIGSMFSGGVNKLADIIVGFTKKFNGADLGKALTDFLSTALGDINWPKVQEAINGLITDFVGFLNAVITPENFSLIGKTLANVMTTLFEGAKKFADEVEWEQWGESISTAINDFVSNFNWVLAAKSISKIASGLLTTLLKAVSTIKWGDIGDKLIEFLSNIDWKSIANYAKDISQKLRDGLKSIWKQLKESGAFEDIMDVIVDFMNEKKEWEKMLKKIKKDVINKIFLEEFKNTINPLNWFDFSELEEKIRSIKDFFGIDTTTTHKSSSGAIHGGTHVHGYATGTVIPPTHSEFLARLGDNNKETEVVSPLSTIKEALQEVMTEQQINVTFQVEGDPNKIFNVVQKEAKQYNKRTGSVAFGGA